MTLWRKLQNVLVGMRATLRGLHRVVRNREVKKAYLGAMVMLVLATWLVSGLSIYLTFRFVRVDAVDGLQLWLNWGLRVALCLVAVLAAPVIALPLTQLLSPAFSGVPFFAGLRAINADRARELSSSPGLGTRAGVWMILRKMPAFLGVGAAFFLIGLIPALGPPVAALGHLLNAARMVSWELLDPYFDACLLDYRARHHLIEYYHYEVLGFGLICAPLLSIPLIGPFFFAWLQAATAQFVTEVMDQPGTLTSARQRA